MHPLPIRCRSLGGMLLGLALLTSVVSTQAAAEFVVPALSSPVVDTAGLLSPSSKQRLEDAIRALQKQGATQIAVLTVKSLEGETIEQASIRVTDKWQLGSGKEDNGVLLMLARDERRVRIEVGQGLEGALTDAYSKRIIDEAITPLFREGDIDAGLTMGVYQIAQRTNPKIDLRPYLEGSLRNPNKRRGRRSGGSPFSTLMFLLLGIPMVLMRAGLFGGGSHYRRRGGYYWGGGGGFSGGGGFGGGGFSGGGGGFSGGGASGGW
ncbi:MAG: hypothetical protein ACI9QQ_000241 [Myxococcota bacterium]|jgi:uncharacterized protein